MPTIEWTEDRIQKLRDMRAKGIRIELCADAFGLPYVSMLQVCHRFGLAKRMNLGAISATRAISRGLSASEVPGCSAPK